MGSQFRGISVAGTDIAGLELLKLLRSTKFVGHGWVGFGSLTVELGILDKRVGRVTLPSRSRWILVMQVRVDFWNLFMSSEL